MYMYLRQLVTDLKRREKLLDCLRSQAGLELVEPPVDVVGQEDEHGDPPVLEGQLEHLALERGAAAHRHLQLADHHRYLVPLNAKIILLIKRVPPRQSYDD